MPTLRGSVVGPIRRRCRPRPGSTSPRINPNKLNTRVPLDLTDTDHGRLVLPAALQESGHQQIVMWYQKRGTAWLRPRVADWAARLRVEPGTLEVADLGHKWGAATAGGRVRIHWAAMQLRPSLLDYVLAHELAHLREAHHGPAFWQVLGRTLPDYDVRKEELARVGAGLWLGNHSVADEIYSPTKSNPQAKPLC